MKVKLYAGIGSRETPKEILSVMFLAARQLARDGWWLLRPSSAATTRPTRGDAFPASRRTVPGGAGNRGLP